MNLALQLSNSGDSLEPELWRMIDLWNSEIAFLFIDQYVPASNHLIGSLNIRLRICKFRLLGPKFDCLTFGSFIDGHGSGLWPQYCEQDDCFANIDDLFLKYRKQAKLFLYYLYLLLPYISCIILSIRCILSLLLFVDSGLSSNYQSCFFQSDILWINHVPGSSLLTKPIDSF